MSVFDPYRYTIESLTERAQKIVAKEMPSINRIKAFKSIVSLIDLTTLSGDDTDQRVKTLCKQAISESSEIPSMAAVCVYPVFANLVRNELKGSTVKTACVAGAFPSGLSPLSVRKDEVAFAIAEGAQEIDMVISRGKLIEGNKDYIRNEVRGIKDVCGDVHLKVILETGELPSVDLIRKASELVLESGGDFLKTSTGKIQPAATPEAFLIMMDTIKEFYDKTGKKIGIKAAGGISTAEESLVYYALVKSVLGEEWLKPELFRIGASRLAGNLIEQIKKLS